MKNAIFGPLLTLYLIITTYKIGSDLLFYLTSEILPFAKVLAIVMINFNFLWSEIDGFLQKKVKIIKISPFHGKKLGVWGY